MKSILNESEKLGIIERINKLSPETKPQWGTMSVSQMLAHCTISLKLAFGEIKPELKEEIINYGKSVKDKVLATEMFSKDLPTSKEFLVTDNQEFEENKNALIEYINRYSKTDLNSPVKGVHPFFGELTVDEWGKLIWKHMNHHLTQFGV
jgi:hypothetical protein